MITIAYIALLGLALTLALVDWRRVILLMLACGILQDPVRKLTPGKPIWLTLSVLAIYVAVVFSSQGELRRGMSDFQVRFPHTAQLGKLFLLFLPIAAVHGTYTLGIRNWEAALGSLFTYLAPLSAVAIGYIYLHREDQLFSLLRGYAIITGIALIGSLLEYFQISFPGLGFVASDADPFRYLPGIKIRMITGFYRGPDIMAWHAANLVAIGVVMAVRSGFALRAWPWFLSVGWGFFNAVISGRRKALYAVVVFVVLFVWRYFRRLQTSHFVMIAFAASVLSLVAVQVASTQRAEDYSRAVSATTESELWARIDGGLTETLQQRGFWGDGLGVATQGVRHFVGRESDFGWQEGGLGKLAAETGVPGLLLAAVIAVMMFSISFRLTAIGDVPGSSQLGRVTLFALVGSTAAGFIVSAQAYSDPILGILSAFFVGCMFATDSLDEHVSAVATSPLPIESAEPLMA